MMSGTVTGIDARLRAGIWRRSCPRTRVGPCVGIGAVGGALVTGVVRSQASRIPNAMSAMSGTVRGIDGLPRADIWRRSCRQKFVDACDRIAAVSDAVVTGVARCDVS